uniref:P40 n=1 Tax=Solanum tuberosum TaxID=4113 RepID=M1D3V4_SOLTU
MKICNLFHRDRDDGPSPRGGGWPTAAVAIDSDESKQNRFYRNCEKKKITACINEYGGDWTSSQIPDTQWVADGATSVPVATGGWSGEAMVEGGWDAAAAPPAPVGVPEVTPAPAAVTGWE